MARLGVVVPVYNEDDNILRLLAELEGKLPVEATVTLVYDLDEDTTLTVLPRHPPGRHRIRPLKNALGRGPARAIRTGLAAAQEEFVLVVMADSSDDLSAARAMWEQMLAGSDVSCGSRYMRGGRQIGGPPLKNLLARLAGWSLHFLAGLPVHDVTNSFKMYRKSLLDRLELESDRGFEVGMEIVVKAWMAGGTVTEVPTLWHDRTAGQSRFRLWRWIPHYLRWYLLALRHRLGLA